MKLTTWEDVPATPNSERSQHRSRITVRDVPDSLHRSGEYRDRGATH
jgi:hypothetical protein